MPYSSPGFLCSDPFRHEMFRPLFRRSAPFPLVLSCSFPLVDVDAERSEVVQEIPHPLFCLTPHTASAPANSPNITHVESLVSSMRATNPANKIRLLRKVASMISLFVLNAASQEPVVGSAQRVVVTRAWAPRETVVQHCLEYLGF